jgi:hypothetical protein
MTSELGTTDLRTLRDRARAGDREALNELLRRAAGRLDVLARSMLRQHRKVREREEAFLLAGCKDVASALWKVDDEATAALMGLFYRHLWVDKMPPLEALRQAQLRLLRQPGDIPALASRRDFLVGPLPPPRPGKGGRRASADLWAGFSLSGSGR